MTGDVDDSDQYWRHHYSKTSPLRVSMTSTLAARNTKGSAVSLQRSFFCKIMINLCLVDQIFIVPFVQWRMVVTIADDLPRFVDCGIFLSANEKEYNRT